VLQTAGVHSPEGVGASAQAAATATACVVARRPAETAVACAAASPCVQLAAAAHEASGIAPAGERPTSTAAHAAAREPRIQASLSHARRLSTQLPKTARAEVGAKKHIDGTGFRFQTVRASNRPELAIYSSRMNLRGLSATPFTRTS
jgi:hypothetical protein